MFRFGRLFLSLVFAFVVAAGDLAGPVAAKDMGSLFDDPTLRHWKQRYPKDIIRNLKKVIWPKLTPRERRKLAATSYKFPLRAADGGHFSFYSFGGKQPRVVMPILPLKFLDDLSIAYAWLYRKGYSLETVSNYVGMLKYHEPQKFGGRYPPPLVALQIPKNVLEMKDVDVLAQRFFKSAVVFVLLHEMAHVLYDHPGYAPGVSRRRARSNEVQADEFALEVMRRLGVAPMGIVLFFLGLTHSEPNRQDFANQAAYEKFLRQATHPVTGNRIKLIARRLHENAADYAEEYTDRAVGRSATLGIAALLSTMADSLNNPGIQRLNAEVGRNTTLRSLAPRRPGEKMAMPRDRGLSVANAHPFHGVFDGRITERDTAHTVRTVLRRKGTRVVGRYDYGTGEGRIDGVVDNGTLYFTWREGSRSGRGTISPGRGKRSFKGQWGYGESSNNGGSWSGVRVRR